ncbi:MAG: hypothetical protein HOO99_14815 [Hyphomicrobiaceae bacterium]|nr:hypothetical protein [Hyphomicrobiaceae bacterium]
MLTPGVDHSHAESVDAHKLLYLLGRPKTLLVERQDRASVLLPAPTVSAEPKWLAQADAAVRHAKANGWLEPVALHRSHIIKHLEGKSYAASTLSPTGRSALVELLKSQPSRQIHSRATKAPNTKRAATATQVNQAQHYQAPLLLQLRSRRDRGRKPLLTDAEVQAGKRLAEEFNRGAMQPRVTANWDPSAIVDRQNRAAPGTAQNVSDGTSRAQENVRRALDAVGSGLQGILVDVCCFELGLEVIEGNHNWARGTARTVLQIALKQLAEHYGLQPRATNPEPASQTPITTRHWAEPNYRPDTRRWRGEATAKPIDE